MKLIAIYSIILSTTVTALANNVPMLNLDTQLSESVNINLNELQHVPPRIPRRNSAKFRRSLTPRDGITLKRGETVCQDKVTSPDLQLDLANSQSDFINLIGSNHTWTGNVFSAHGHMVTFGCIFSLNPIFNPTPAATVHGQDVSTFLKQLDDDCGKNATGYFETTFAYLNLEFRTSYGRTGTDMGFCGGAGVAFGTTKNQ